MAAIWVLHARPASASVVVAAVARFFAPYAHLRFAVGEMPDGLRIGMAICVAVLFVAATAGVITKTRKPRREASVAADDPVRNLQTGALDTELVIDLTGDDVTIERTPN